MHNFLFSVVQSVSQPVSKYRDSRLANLVKPVTIIAVSNWTFSSLSTSLSQQPSQTSHAYSSKGLIKVREIFDKLFEDSMYHMYLSFLKAFICFIEDSIMLLIRFVHFPFEVFMAFYNFNLLIVEFNYKVNILYAVFEIINALVFWGLKSTSH